MEYRTSFERIDNVKEIEKISRSICKAYNFEDYIDYKIIDIGYEDFNYILNTTTGKYFVKIFNTDRDEASCERLIKILTTAIDYHINTPKLYKTVQNSYIYKVEINNIELKLCVMQYIQGENLYVQNRELKLEELEEIANIATKINTIDFGIKETFYDEWTVTNLLVEYEKKKEYLTKENNQKIEKVIEEFKKIDFTELKYSYIHGDIIKANLILDEKEELYVIDFSAFNYLPRIVEIVVILGNCVSDDRSETIKKMNYFIRTYHKLNPLEEIEIKYLPIFIKALASMFIIQASYIKENSGDYIENEYWLSEGIKILQMNIDSLDINI